MPDATEQDGLLCTDLAQAREKLFRGGDMGKGLPRIDVADADQVFMLALELHGAHERRLHQVNYPEWRALVRLAVLAGPILTHALALIDATDSTEGTNAERAEASRVALEALLVISRKIRPFLNRSLG